MGFVAYDDIEKPVINEVTVEAPASDIMDTALSAIPGLGGLFSSGLISSSSVLPEKVEATVTPALAVGGVTKLIPFNVGDEVVAGGAAGLDYLLDDTSLSDAYNQRLNQVRGYQEGFEDALDEATQGAGSTLYDIGAAFSGAGPKVPTGIFSVAKGIKPAIGNIAKAGGLGLGYGALYGAGGGEGAEERVLSGLAGAALGGGLGAGTTAALEGIAGATRVIPGLFSRLPSEEEALTQAFATDATAQDAAPALKYLKNRAVITDKTSTPFQRTQENLTNALESQSSLIGNVVESGAPVKIDDILPTFDDIPKNISGAARKAWEQAIETEQEAILSISNGQAALPARDVWEIRQNLDKIPNWSTTEGPFRGEAYKAIRTKFQKALLRAIGNDEAAASSLFDDYSQMMDGKDYVDRLASAEVRGSTRSDPIGMNLLGIFRKSPEGAMRGRTGAEKQLHQAFGNTARQQIEKVVANSVFNLESVKPSLFAVSATPFSEREEKQTSGQFVPYEEDEPQRLGTFTPSEDAGDDKVTEKTEQYSDIIDKVSAEFGVDKALINAMINQESAGDTKAESDKGALGLMQLLPSTAKEVAESLGIAKPDLTDPETNIRLGTAYIARLLGQYQDRDLALTAYHSGPGTVSRLLRMVPNAEKLSDILPYLGPVGRKYAASVIGKMTA